MLTWQPGMMGVISLESPSGALLGATQPCLLISAEPQTWVLPCLPKASCSCLSREEDVPQTLASLHLMQKMPRGWKTVAF